MSAHAGLATLLIFALSCGGSAPVEHPAPRPDDNATAAARTVKLPALYTGQRSVLADSTIVQALPDTCFAAVAIKSPIHIASAIDSSAIFREYKQAYAAASQSLRLPSGTSLWEVETWRDLGIAIDKPAAAAFWVEKRAVTVFVVSLSTPLLFVNRASELASNAGLAHTTSQVGSSAVLRFDNGPDMAVIQQGETGMLVIATRSEDLSKAIARLTGQSEQATLIASGRMAKAFAGLDYGEDLAGFIAFDIIAARIASDLRESDDPSWYQSEIDRIELAIQSAKSAQKPQEEVDALEAELSKQLGDNDRYQLRRAGEAKLNAEVMMPLGTVAFGMDLDGKDTRMRAKIEPEQGSLVARLFALGDAPLQLPARLTETPIFMFGSRVNGPAAHELFGILLQAEGKTRGRVLADMKAATGVDPVQVLALLQGEMSGAMTLNRELFLRGEDSMHAAPEAFGMHLLFGLKDSAAAQGLLAQAAASPTLKKYSVPSAAGVALEIPSFNERKLRIEVVDSFVEVRSLGGTAPVSAPRAQPQLSDSADNLALMLVDPMVWSWLLVGIKSSDDGSYYESIAAEHPTPATRKRLAEIEKERKLLAGEESVLQRQRLLAASRTTGPLVFVMRPQSGSLAVLAALSGEAANLGRSLQRLVEAMVPKLESARLSAPTPIETVQGKLEALQQERWRLLEGRR